MHHESGLMPPGAEIAMQRADERSAYIESEYANFCDEYISEAMTAIENDTLMFDDSDPLEAAYEHLDEDDVKKLIQCVVVAKRNLLKDRVPVQAVINSINIAFERVLFAVEAAATVEADAAAERGEFHPDNRF